MVMESMMIMMMVIGNYDLIGAICGCIFISTVTNSDGKSLIASSYFGGGSSYSTESYLLDDEWLSFLNNGGWLCDCNEFALLDPFGRLREWALFDAVFWFRAGLLNCSTFKLNSGCLLKLWQMIPHPQKMPIHAIRMTAVIGNIGVDLGFLTSIINQNKINKLEYHRKMSNNSYVEYTSFVWYRNGNFSYIHKRNSFLFCHNKGVGRYICKHCHVHKSHHTPMVENICACSLERNRVDIYIGYRYHKKHSLLEQRMNLGKCLNYMAPLDDNMQNLVSKIKDY